MKKILMLITILSICNLNARWNDGDDIVKASLSNNGILSTLEEEIEEALRY